MDIERTLQSSESYQQEKIPYIYGFNIYDHIRYTTLLLNQLKLKPGNMHILLQVAYTRHHDCGGRFVTPDTMADL